MKSKLLAILCVLSLMGLSHAEEAASENVAAITVGETNTIPYTTLEGALGAAATGQTITLLQNATLASATVISGKTLTIDLAKQTLTFSADITANLFSFTDGACVTFKNGTIDLSGVQTGANANFQVSDSAQMTFEEVNLIGENYKSAYAVLYADKTCMGDHHAIALKNCKVALKNEQSELGGFLKADNTAAKFLISGCTITLTNPVRGIINGDVTLENSSLTITGEGTPETLDNGINSSNLKVTNSKISISNGWGRGLTLAGSNTVFIDADSSVTLSQMGEGAVMFKNISPEGAKLTVAGTLTMDEAIVYENTTPEISLVEVSGSGQIVNTSLVAQIGETFYASLDDAIAAANEAETSQAVTVKLLQNVTRTENVALGAAHPITLDLAGFTLDCGTAQFRTQSTGLVTLTGNGTVKNSNTEENSNCAAVFVVGASSLLLDGVTVEGTYGLYVNGTAEVLAANVSATDVALAVNNSAQVTIGTAQGDNSAILFAGAGNSISTQAAGGESGMRVKIYGGTFKVTNPTYWYCATIYWASHGALEVYGGSFKNPAGTGNAPALYQKNGSVTIAEGSFEGYDALKLGVEAEDTTEVVLTVTGGCFHALNRAGLYYKTTNKGYNCTQYEISISGGTFTSNAPASTIKTVLDLSVITPSVNFTGGLFTANVSDYCAAGYMATETTVEGETLWAVQPAVAQIGEKLYASLEAAITAAQSGDTVTLLQDVTQEDGFVLTKDLTLDLGGKTFTVETGSSTSNRNIKVAGTANLTVTNGTMVAGGKCTADNHGTNGASAGTGCYGTLRFESTGKLVVTDVTLKNSRPWGMNLKLLSGTAELENVTILSTCGGGVEVAGNEKDHTQHATVTMRNCTIKQTYKHDHTSACVAVSYGGELTVESGSYTSDFVAVYVYNSGGIQTIQGGTFTGATYAIKADRAADASAAEVHVSGGTFVGPLAESGAKISLTGGLYTADPSTYCAAGYMATGTTVEGETLWAVQPAVAQIGETTYTSLEAAIADAQSGDTVTLLQDVTIAAPVTVDEAIKIDLAEHTVTSSVGFVFEVTTGATIQNGTITGGNIKVGSSEGTVTLEKLQVSGYPKSTQNNGALYVWKGAVTARQSTFVASYSGGYGVYLSSSATPVSLEYCTIKNSVASTADAFRIGVTSDSAKISIKNSTIESQVASANAIKVTTGTKATITVGEGNTVLGCVAMTRGSSSAWKFVVEGGKFAYEKDGEQLMPFYNSSTKYDIKNALIVTGGSFKVPEVAAYVQGGVLTDKGESEAYRYVVQPLSESCVAYVVTETGLTEYTSLESALGAKPTVPVVVWQDARVSDCTALSGVTLTTGPSATLTVYATLEDLLDSGVTLSNAKVTTDVALSQVSCAEGKLTDGIGFTADNYAGYAGLLAEGFLFDAETYNVTPIARFKARIGSLGYDAFGSGSAWGADALEAAVANDSAESQVNDEVILLSNSGDVFVPDTIWIAKPYATFTLDLNGHNVKQFLFTYKDVSDQTTYPHHAKVTIKNGTLKGGVDYGISTNGTVEDVTLTLEQVLIQPAGADSWGIYFPSSGSLNIGEGCSITAGATGIEIRAGELTVNGGTIASLADHYSVEANGSGTTTVGAGIAVAQHGTKLPLKVTITDGEISGPVALSEANPQGNEAEAISQVALDIQGGTFVAQSAAVVTEDCTGFVSGGNFSNAVPLAYCATGKVPKTLVEGDEGYQADAPYTVVEPTSETFVAVKADGSAVVYESLATVPTDTQVYIAPGAETDAAVEKALASATATTGPAEAPKNATEGTGLTVKEVAEVLGGAFTVKQVADAEGQTTETKLSYHYNFGVAGLEVNKQATELALSVVAKLTEGESSANRTLVGRTLQVVLKKGDGKSATYSVANPVFNAQGECRVAVPWGAMTHGTNAIKVKVVK
ncbi:MAG: hypothetical protein ACI4QJ_05405 [Candidatus Spyradenecus sp.]